MTELPRLRTGLRGLPAEAAGRDGIERVWFGLLHLCPDEGDDVERETVIVVAYEPHRLFRVATSMEGLPSLVAMLRQAADHGRNVCAPRCGSCAAPLEIPPIDEDAACASA